MITIGESETYTEGSARYTQQLTTEITIADVDKSKLNVVELDDPRNGPGFNVHIVMAEGKKAKRTQVLTERGQSTRKAVEYSDNEFYLNDKEKAYQTVEVLRRMVKLSLQTTSEEGCTQATRQPRTAAGDNNDESQAIAPVD